MRLVAADIGGTKTLLALAESSDSGIRIVAQRRFESAAFGSFDAMLEAFFAATGGRTTIDAACFAVAGPISADGQNAKVTNLDWGLAVPQLQRQFAIRAARMVNDFEAQAYGISELDARELTLLQRGKARNHAPRLVLGAGTGLGVCQLVWCDGHYMALPSEGGHADFAPNGSLQNDLLAWLRDLHGGHVSIERLLSGAGLVSIYRFLSTQHASAGSRILEGVAEEDAAAAISTSALSDRPDRLARDALDLFVSIYGAHAGSLALVALPFGGIYVAGGIAPRILPAMTNGPFMKAFNDKGRMAKITCDMPVAIVMNPETGLAGALQVAQHLARSP